MTVHRNRTLVKAMRRSQPKPDPQRWTRGVVVSSTIGQTLVTLDGNLTAVPAFNFSHTQSLAAGTIVRVLVTGKQIEIHGAYGATGATGYAVAGAPCGRFYIGAGIGISGTTVTTITASGITTDFTNGGLVALTGTSFGFTAPVAGFYQVNAYLYGTPPSSAEYITIGVDVGATLDSSGEYTDLPSSSASPGSAQFSDIINVPTAGTAVTLVGRTSATGWAWTYSRNLNYISAALVSV